MTPRLETQKDALAIRGMNEVGRGGCEKADDAI
jgi:hypothetical protein